MFMRSTSQQKGSILVIAVVMSILLMGMSAAYAITSLKSSMVSQAATERTTVQYIAEGAVSHAFQSLSRGGDGFVSGSFAGGTYSTTTEDFSGDGLYRRVIATGTYNEQSATIEVIITGRLPSTYCGGNGAIVVGNKEELSGYELEFGGEGASTCTTCGGTGEIPCDVCGGSGGGTCTHCGGTGEMTCNYYRCMGAGGYYYWGHWRTCYRCGGDGVMTCSYCGGDGYATCSTCGGDGMRPCPTCGGDGITGSGDHADDIQGNVHVNNGDVRFEGDASCNGTITATGEVYGDGGEDATPVNGADAIVPPDLTSMHYEQIADYKISTSTSGWSDWSSGGYRLPSSDPRHIFVRNERGSHSYRSQSDLGISTDRPNFLFTDPYTSYVTDRDEPGSPTYGYSQDRITISSEGNRKIYYVEGNLWLEPQSFSSKLMTEGGGTQITVIVRGNIYMCDALYLEDREKDAILFIAMAGGDESFIDANGNKQYDAGEQIINDDGDGVYEGPVEGCGNIYYGDPNSGPVGTIEAFMYAENNFEDHCLDQNGNPLDFKIRGCMSAGNLVSINRDTGNVHTKMDMIFDSRIRDGEVDLPGIPEEGGVIGGVQFQIKSWRMIYGNN